MNEPELDEGPDDRSHDRLDEQLRRAFAPPTAGSFAAQARAIAMPVARRPVWPWLLAAAALLVTMVFAFDRPRRGPEGHDGQQLGSLWVAAYQHALSSGFGGGACCEPAFDLAQACEQQFATKLGISVGSVHLLGCYCGLPTGGCMALLARAGSSPVGVYIVPVADDPHPQLPADCSLHLARREMGSIVLYALSQSSAADALAEFFVPSN